MTDTFTPPWPAGTRHLQVDDLRVDLRYRRLTAPGQEAELPQKVFDLLLLFLAEPQVLHTRADLFERIWAGTIVEDANLSQSVWMLRRALGPARKGWIRTVAKAGYVFEPPALPQPVDGGPAPAAKQSAPADSLPVAPAGRPESAAIFTAPPPARSGRHWHLAAAAAVLLAVAGGAAWFGFQPSAPAAPQPAARAVVLIDVDNGEAGPDGAWPTALLHAWLDWKLGALPEVTVLTQAHLATDAGDTSPTMVVLASSQDPQRPQDVQLRVRYYDTGGEHRMELRGSAADVPRMVDQLSRQLLAQLLPARADAPWPALDLDAGAARRYAGAFAAYERRDWATAVQRNRETIEQAPDFGLARLQMAHALSRLGQANAAREQMTAARRLLAPIPTDAGRVLDAFELAMDPQSAAEAAQAYGALARRHSDNAGFQLREAWLLDRAGLPEQARAILERPDWALQPAGVRAQRALTLANVQLSLGAWQEAVRLAEEASHLAQPGPGWALERGQALLLRAQAETNMHGDEVDLSLFEQAASEFESAGNHNDALYARFLAQSVLPPTGDTRQLDTLLAKAHAGGYRQLETAMLRRAAFQHYAIGHHVEYRRYLQQALATAHAAGDRLAVNLLDLDLLNEDLLRGDLAGADGRVARLRNAPLQGNQALWVAQFDAVLTSLRGDYGKAKATLADAIKRTRTVPPMAAARLSCLRAELSLQQGDLAQARTQWQQCGAPEHPFLRLQAELGRAGTSLLAGDRIDAKARLRDLRGDIERLDNGPDRWLLALQMGGLASRLGETQQAAAQFKQVLPLAHDAGYAWLAAQAEAGLAETAAARGDWTASTRHAANARAYIDHPPWVLESRLEQVAIVAALARGEQEQALSRLADLDRRAHRHGDAIVQLQVHSLMSAGVSGPCDPEVRATLVASTGLRGANLDWLATGPRMHPASALAASEPGKK